MGGKAFEITQWVSIISAKSFAAKRCKKINGKVADGKRWIKGKLRFVFVLFPFIKM